MSPADGQELSDLYQASPDTGQIQIAPLYHLDAYAAFIAVRPSAIGVVAESPDFEGFVGAGFVHFGQCYFEDELRDYASLSGVVVHPDYRRRGIASRLAEWRVECARQRLGDNGLILASIQKQNTGSFVVAEKWSRQFAGQITTGAVRIRAKSSGQIADVTVRPVEMDELAAVANGLNAFYSSYNLYEPHSDELLRDWLAQSPFETPFHHYYVAVNQAGDILAGLAVSEQYRAIEMQVKQIPAAMRLLNKLVKFVPPDGALKQLAASKIWFAPGQLKAAQQLWETIRWEWHTKASTVTFFFDSRSPVADVFTIPFWMPKGVFVLAVNGPVLMQDEKLIYPI